MKPPVLLRIYKQSQLEGVKQFTETQIVIGRNPDLQLSLADEAVSPLHAIIEERDGAYYVSDLGSLTGTLRNGNKVLDEKIESGDEISVGPYRMQFFIGVPKPVAPPQNFATPPIPTQATPPIPEAQNPNLKVVATPNLSTPSSTVTPPIPKVETPRVEVPKPAAPRIDTPKAASQGPIQLKVPGSAPAAKAHRKKGSTFAPGSHYRDVSEILKPSKGTIVEVVVAWRERVLSSYHFNEKQAVTIGSDPSCDILIPVSTTISKFPILKVDSLVSVRVMPEMTGDLFVEGSKVSFSDLHRQNRMRSVGNGYEVDLQQNEMIRVGFWGDTISIYIRFVPESTKPMVAPVLDLTASEATGIILSIVITLIFALYMMIYSPSGLEDEALREEPIRKAIVTFNPPKPKEKTVVIVEDKPVQTEKKVVKVVDKVRETKAPAPEKKEAPGKAAEVAPKKTPDKAKTLTSARPGGAIKTGKEGANAKSEKPDPTKVGLLSVFGSKGAQSQLDKAYSGSGELQGLAGAATGYAGQAEDRAGDTIGSKLKDTGAGGKGSATVGISGVGTQGRGTGTYGYGEGGIGKKGSVDINVGGQEAEFTGSIDREAIRRVIIANKRAIRSCYERVLQRKPDLYGKLVLEWDIEERGRVTRTAVKSNSLGDDEVATCIVNRLRTWRFPEPPQDQVGRVTYPFVFTSQ